MTHVVGDTFVGDHLRDCYLYRQPGSDQLLVVVQQLDRQILKGMGPTQQREAFFLFEVREGEGRVLLELDVFALQNKTLAGRALPLFAAVRQHHALLERCTEDCLAFIDLDVDADRFEPDDVLRVSHNPLAVLR